MKGNFRQGESKITNTNGGEILRRLLPAIKRYWTESPFELCTSYRVRYKTVAYNATSVGVGSGEKK